jgi:hypothetical protein
MIPLFCDHFRQVLVVLFCQVPGAGIEETDQVEQRILFRGQTLQEQIHSFSHQGSDRFTSPFCHVAQGLHLILAQVYL